MVAAVLGPTLSGSSALWWTNAPPLGPKPTVNQFGFDKPGSEPEHRGCASDERVPSRVEALAGLGPCCDHTAWRPDPPPPRKLVAHPTTFPSSLRTSIAKSCFVRGRPLATSQGADRCLRYRTPLSNPANIERIDSNFGTYNLEESVWDAGNTTRCTRPHHNIVGCLGGYHNTQHMCSTKCATQVQDISQKQPGRQACGRYLTCQYHTPTL